MSLIDIFNFPEEITWSILVKIRSRQDLVLKACLVVDLIS